MTDGDSIAQVAVVILLLALAVPALSTAHDYAGTPFEYHEDVTVDYENTVAVSANATTEGYSDDPTVVVNGSTLTAGVDYRWNASSGELSWQDTANTTAGDTATVEYEAYQRTQESQAAWMVIAPLMGLFGLFGFVSAVRALIQLVGEVFDA